MKYKKPKILTITESFPPQELSGGGISTSLIIESTKNDFEYKILTQKFDYEKNWRFNGFDVLPILDRFSPNFSNFNNTIKSLRGNLLSHSNFKKIKRQINSFNPDLLYIQLTNINLINKLMKLDIPIIIDVRDVSIKCPIMYRNYPCQSNCSKCLRMYIYSKYSNLKILKFLSHLILPIILFILNKEKDKLVKNINNKKTVSIISISHFVKNILIGLNIREDKISVISNISTKFNFKQKDKKNQIVFAGVIEKPKGIFDVVKAFHIVSKKQIKLELVLIGNGPALGDIKEYIIKNKIKDVKFLGKISNQDVLKIYNESKMIIAPSILGEAFGRFIQEGISTRTPVIATRVGGIPEGIKNHETGLLVEPNNPKQLAKAIKELLTNKKLYNKIVRNLGKEAWKYSPKRIRKQRLKIYKELLNIHHVHINPQK